MPQTDNFDDDDDETVAVIFYSGYHKSRKINENWKNIENCVRARKVKKFVIKKDYN